MSGEDVRNAGRLSYTEKFGGKFSSPEPWVYVFVPRTKFWLLAASYSDAHTQVESLYPDDDVYFRYIGTDLEIILTKEPR